MLNVNDQKENQPQLEQIVTNLLDFGKAADYTNTLNEWFLAHYASDMLPEEKAERDHFATHLRALTCFLSDAELALAERGNA